MLRRLFLVFVLLCPLVAQAAAPTIDGTPATGGPATSTTGTVTYTTPSTNDVIVLLFMAENTSGSPVTTSLVADTSLLTWTKRASVSGTISQAGGAGSCVGLMEEWSAKSAGAQTNDVITVTLSAAVDGVSLIAFGVAGTNATSQWDSNVGLPSTQSYDSTTLVPSRTISTTSANDLVIGSYAECRNSTHAAGTGYTALATKQDGGTNWDKLQSESQGFTSIQTNLLVDFGTATASWFFIADALTADAAAASGTHLLPVLGVGR